MTPCSSLTIGSRIIGAGHPCFVIAEVGVNHNGELDRALRLIDHAAAAGADAVKFQTFKAERLVSVNAPKAAYQRDATDPGQSQLEMLRALELRESDYGRLIERCRERGILFLSTPFEEDSASFLDGLGVGLFKLPSGEVTNLPFLRKVAAFGRPVILSTGMSTLAEVAEAVAVFDTCPLALLHCVSNYPAAPEDSNLRAMDTMTRAFGLPVGWSDHTLGIEVSLAAVALGATIVEKHFTEDCSLPGPDHRASLEPAGLKALVTGIRAVEAALGHGRKAPAPSEAGTAQVARKSLFARHDLPAGHVLDADDLVALRPGDGIPPGRADILIGRRLVRAVAAGSKLGVDAAE